LCNLIETEPSQLLIAAGALLLVRRIRSAADIVNELYLS
jgi:hypothetical protein